MKGPIFEPIDDLDKNVSVFCWESKWSLFEDEKMKACMLIF